MGQAPDGSAYNTEGRGWPLIAGASDFGESVPAPKKFTTIPTRLTEEGDVVLSIRATIGPKVIADGIYCLGRGVAGIRPGPELDRRFLWHWLTDVAPNLAAKARGATFKQVNRNDIGELQIPVLPLPEQRRIAAILDAAEGLRARRREALHAGAALATSLFLEGFGDPIGNPHHYPIRSLLDLVDPSRPITYGILKPGPEHPEGIRYVRVVDMKDGGIETGGLRRTSPAISNAYRRSLLKGGDLLLSIRGHVGRLALVADELEGANITQDTARLAIRDVSPIYVLECLRTPTYARWMARHAKGVAVTGINLVDVKRMPIPVPSVEAQLAFANRLTTISRLSRLARASLGQFDSLLASLQYRAFRGEL